MRNLVFVLALTLSSVAFAQTGTYTTFGKGCRGSGAGGPGCLSANYSANWGGNRGAATFALAVNSGGSTRVICGFEFYAATISGTATRNASILEATATGNPGKTLASTTINWTAKPGWHTAKLRGPIVIQPNKKFFLSFENPGRLPYMTNSTQAVEHWHSGPNWRGPFTSGRWNYNILCCGQGGAVPALSATGVPSITKRFSVDLTRARPNGVAIQILGVSNTTWNSLRLPLDLSGAGASGCSLLVSFDIITGARTDASGRAQIQYAFPNDKRWIGVQFHNQWTVLDASVNRLGLSFSNGGTGKVGS